MLPLYPALAASAHAKYTQLIQLKDDHYGVTTATTIEGAKNITASGFRYANAKDRKMLFKKPKRFVSLGQKRNT